MLTIRHSDDFVFTFIFYRCEAILLSEIAI